MEYRYLIASVIIIVLAVVYFLFPPKNANAFYGYRTPLSRKNEGNWRLANRLASVIFLILSVILCVQYAVFSLFQWEGAATVWLDTMLLGIAILIIIVEIKLRKIK